MCVSEVLCCVVCLQVATVSSTGPRCLWSVRWSCQTSRPRWTSMTTTSPEDMAPPSHPPPTPRFRPLPTLANDSGGRQRTVWVRLMPTWTIFSTCTPSDPLRFLAEGPVVPGLRTSSSWSLDQFLALGPVVPGLHFTPVCSQESLGGTERPFDPGHVVETRGEISRSQTSWSDHRLRFGISKASAKI